MAAVFPHGNRTRFQKVPLRLGRDPVHKTGTARICRIGAEVIGDQLQEPVPRGRRQGRRQRSERVHFVIGEAERRHDDHLSVCDELPFDYYR